MNDSISRQAAISEKKMQIVINNYFKSECNVDTSIRQAFEKGFRIGVKKGLAVQPERKNESVGCNGCRYDWFGDPRCNRCARAFQDYYEADTRSEKHETD